MKEQIKRVLRPPYWLYQSTKRSRGAKQFFSRIYENNLWGDKESVSGPRSTIARTHNIRKEIPQIIKRFNVKYVLDAPCGDYNWFRFVQRGADVHYIGADIVEALVAGNQERYGGEHTEFKCLDVRKDPLPRADLWLCRDCWRHLSLKDVFTVLDNFCSSNISYFLASTMVTCRKNEDILTGGARNLNLELPPFNLCKPILYVDDWVEGATGISIYEQHLALWDKDQVSASIASNRALRRI